MNIEEEITKCEIYSKQIKQYDPDPFYVDYFFTKYINSINNIVMEFLKKQMLTLDYLLQKKLLRENLMKKQI